MEMTNELRDEFFEALTQRDAVAVAQFIADGVSPNTLSEGGISALYTATSDDDYATMLVLLDGGADPNLSGTSEQISKWYATPLHNACKNGRKSPARLLLARGANPSLQAENRPNAAFLLLEFGRSDENCTKWWRRFAVEALRDMLRSGLPASGIGPGGRTLLEEALHCRLPLEAIEMLIAAGADPNHKGTINGSQLMHIASSRNRVDVLQFLVNRGFRLDVPDNAGQTPLYYYGSVETCNALVELGADINHRDHAGNTPLMDILELQSPSEVARSRVRELIDAGADVFIKNYSGRGPIDTANRHHPGETAALIGAAAARQKMASVARAAAATRAKP